MPSVKIDTSESAQLQPGIHIARIEDAVEAVSKAGNEMLKLTCKVGGLTFNSWVVFTTRNSVNVADFARAIGRKVVEGQTLTIEADDCVGKSAKVELGEGERVSQTTGKPYLEIKRWIPREAAQAPKPAPVDDIDSDEIPF